MILSRCLYIDDWIGFYLKGCHLLLSYNATSCNSPDDILVLVHLWESVSSPTTKSHGKYILRKSECTPRSHQVDPPRGGRGGHQRIHCIGAHGVFGRRGHSLCPLPHHLLAAGPGPGLNSAGAASKHPWTFVSYIDISYHVPNMLISNNSLSKRTAVRRSY